MSLFINRDLGRAYYYAHRYDAALGQLRQTLELDPTMAGVNEWISWCYEKRGARDKSIQAYLNAEKADGANQSQVDAQKQFYKHAGWNAFWRQELKRTRYTKPGPDGYVRALALVRLGEKEAALKTLRRQIELHSVWVTWMNVDPELDAMRSDARFQPLVQTVER